MEWTDDLIEGLKKAWQAGDSISKIARDFKVSANSISGKIHRLQKLYPLDFPGRPSPIKRNGIPVQKRIRAVPLPPLESCSSPVKTIAALAPLVEPAALIVRPPEPPPLMFHREPPALQGHNLSAPPPTPSRRLRPCCWPIGRPGTAGFRFCEEPVAGIGKSYCPTHDDAAHGRPPRAPGATPKAPPPTAQPG